MYRVWLVEVGVYRVWPVEVGVSCEAGNRAIWARRPQLPSAFVTAQPPALPPSFLALPPTHPSSSFLLPILFTSCF